MDWVTDIHVGTDGDGGLSIMLDRKTLLAWFTSDSKTLPSLTDTSPVLDWMTFEFESLFKLFTEFNLNFPERFLLAIVSSTVLLTDESLLMSKSETSLSRNS